MKICSCSETIKHFFKQIFPMSVAWLHHAISVNGLISGLKTKKETTTTTTQYTLLLSLGLTEQCQNQPICSKVNKQYSQVKQNFGKEP